MDAEEEEAPSKPFPPLEQGSVTDLDAPEQLLSAPPQCDTEQKNLPHGRGGDEPVMPPPGPAFGEEKKDVMAGELSEAVATGTNIEKRDGAEFVHEKEEDLDEGAKATDVVGEERVVAQDACLPVKNKGIEISGLANEGCEMKLINEAEEKVAADMANVVGEEIEGSVAWKAEGADEGNAMGICCPVLKETDSAGQMVDAIDGVGMKDETMGANDTEAERELADETNMADSTVETVNEEEGAAMPGKTEEALVGTEMAHRAYVAGTMGEIAEADGADMEHGIGEADDEVEVTEEFNETGPMDAMSDAEEEADGPGAEEETLEAEEEALEAEETEIANDADLMEEEADFADTADDTEAAEETEEMEVTEDLSRSISGGKRKRGKNLKSTGRVPARKKMEEDVCFICFDGGELVLCDRRGCPKAYHPSCVNRDEAFFRAKGKWNCGWHLCSNCEKNAYYMCYTCTFSLCKACIKDAVIFCVRGNKGFCETCMRTVMLIEQGNKDVGQVDFDDKNSWEYLFKDYYIDLKGKLSLTYDEIAQAKNPWKGSDPAKLESPNELYDAYNDRSSPSDSSSDDTEVISSKRRKAKKRLKSRSKEGDLHRTVTVTGVEGPSEDDGSDWASKELLEFVMHMRSGDKSVLSQFDVQALLLEYIKKNKLRDPRRKSQIICDARLQNLFSKPRVGHFEMLKLLESHFLLKEDSRVEDLQRSIVDTEVSHLEGDGNSDSYLKAGKDKRRKTRKKGDERGPQSNLDDYAAIDNHNINLIYLRRNLVEDLLEDTEKFHDKVVGSFVRIRISGSGQKQDLYRLVQVIGTCKAADPYKVGKRMTDILLEILNLNKTEVVSVDIISNQEFTEDECKRLRQSIKCGLINRLTVGDIQDKAMALQAVRVKDWLETEIVRLSHLRDRASEKGRRKELRECVEKLQLLKTPEERQRRLEEIPEIHADPNMNPSHESEEDEDEMDDKRQENFIRPKGTAYGRRGREITSPRSGSSISNDSWSGTRNYPSTNHELRRNMSNKGFPSKGDDFSHVSEVLNDAQLLQGRDSESQLYNRWERQNLSLNFEGSAKNTHPVLTSDSFTTATSEASVAPSSTEIAPPAVKISEAEKMWHYQDPSGKVQGPFSMLQLRKWSNTGYFPADLKIWRTMDKQDESILLTDALVGKFSKVPSMENEPFPKASTVHDLHSASSHSGKPHMPARQDTECLGGGRSKLDQNIGSLKSHSTLGSPGQTTGGSWRSKDNINSSVSRLSPFTVEVPKNPANGWGSDAGIRNESTNLPSPTPQTASGATKGQAFENKWSPTPVQSTGFLLGNPSPEGHGGSQASMGVVSDNIVQNADGSGSQPGITSAPKSDKGMPFSSSDMSQVTTQVTMVAPVLVDAVRGLDIKSAAVNMQNLVVASHNSHAEAQGWGYGLVPRPEMPSSIQMRGGEPQAWAGPPSQRVEPNNSITMPAQLPSHGQWGNASSVQTSASFSTGNPTVNFTTPGFRGMNTPEPWRPPTSSIQSNVAPPAPPNVPWGMVVAENQNAGWGVMPGNPNMSWGGPLPSNMNINWMPGQGPAPGNTNPGWVATTQGPSPVNAVGWVPQGRPHVNANAAWDVSGQGMAPGSANSGWAASSGNPGMWGSEQSHNGDRFPNQVDRGPHGGDSGYGGGKPWNRQSSSGREGRGGSSTRSAFGGERGVCKFHENGHCRKGASCDFLHT